MAITPKVPHDDLEVVHEIRDADLLASYRLALVNPDGSRAAPDIVLHNGSPEAGWHGWTTAKAIEGLIQHVEYHQSTPFACAQNAEVLEHLRAALEATKRRASERESRGVLYDHRKP